MFESELQRSLWGEILLISRVLRNLTLTSSLSVPPSICDKGEAFGGALEGHRLPARQGGAAWEVRSEGLDGTSKTPGTLGSLVNAPGYRVWDLVSHKVWDVRGPDFDELVRGGWWKKPPGALKPKWEEDAPLNLMEGLYLEEEPPKVDASPPPDDDDTDGGGVVEGGGGSVGGGSVGGGGPFRTSMKMTLHG